MQAIEKHTDAGAGAHDADFLRAALRKLGKTDKKDQLGKRSLPGTLYILDEPTTGLHMHEVGKLIKVLHALVDKGASVVVIEHNTDMILAADHVLDMGPGGGENGGLVVSQGTPEAIVADPDSVTGRFLMQERRDRLSHGDVVRRG